MENLIKNIAKLCSLTYNPPQINKELFISQPYYLKNNESFFYKCIEEPNFYSSHNDCQVYTCKYNKTLCISFRCTEHIEDIFTDLNISRVLLNIDFPSNLKKNLYVHNVFLKQFESVKLNIEQEIIEYYINTDKKDKSVKENKIIFSGHSLGGALATIASLYFKLKYKELNIICITFETPRVGCNDFVKLFNQEITNSYRFVNDNDPIPGFPTAWRFKNVKRLHRLNNDKIMKELKPWRFYIFIKNLFLSFFNLGGYNSLNGHDCIKDLEICF